MSNAVAIVPISDLQAMATAFAKSGLFGTKTADQCMALLLLASAEGVHPAIAMRDFDVIQGKPAKKAEAMLRSFLAAGGKVEWHRLEDTGASATFSHPQGGTATISWDEARAKKAGLSAKEMYGKYPRAMYRSRVVSEGCRTIYPASTSGLYVPEEVRSFQKAPKEKDMGAAEVVKDDDDAALQGLADQPNWKAELEAATSADALRGIWERIPEEQRKHFKDVKDARKTALTQPATA